jgi:hypothetical protein
MVFEVRASSLLDRYYIAIYRYYIYQSLCNILYNTQMVSLPLLRIT